MSKPKNKDEYRKEMAEAFAHVLEEKGLSWKKEWRRPAQCHNQGKLSRQQCVLAEAGVSYEGISRSPLGNDGPDHGQ